MQAVVTGFMC